MEITFQSFYLLFYVICTIFKVESHRIFKYVISSHVLSVKMHKTAALVSCYSLSNSTHTFLH